MPGRRDGDRGEQMMMTTTAGRSMARLRRTFGLADGERYLVKSAYLIRAPAVAPERCF